MVIKVIRHSLTVEKEKESKSDSLQSPKAPPFETREERGTLEF